MPGNFFAKFCISTIYCIALTALCHTLPAQVVINEGSNRNYSSVADEDGEYPDWIELYNPGADTVHLAAYSLSDDASAPGKWTFPNVLLLPGEFRTVFCSGKDRKPVTGFVNVLNTGTFNAVVGWNTHVFTTPFHWDGISNILINTCSYSATGYTSNSVFNQSQTSFYSTSFAFMDGSPAICQASYGSKVKQRPNMMLNGHVIGSGNIQNCNTCYPAPYGNWYWAAKHQMLILASELTAAGLSEGDITSLAFDVASTDPNTVYSYIDISLKLVAVSEVTSSFETVDPNNFLHTNFKIKSSGETVYLNSLLQGQASSLLVSCNDLDNSSGSFPDSSSNITLFQTATPGASNNQSAHFSGYLQPPVFSVPSGIYTALVNVTISNPNGFPTYVTYTTDGSDPTPASALYTGTPVFMLNTGVLKARAFSLGSLPSRITVATYFAGIQHTTPVLSVVTDNQNLYGPSGIFDNWQFDWEKAAYVDYFDTARQLIFSQRAGIQVDGGWGGSRANPQHSFRVELDDAVLGDGPVNYQLIPNKPDRTKYSKFYLRNGSNQYLVLPYKDACETEAMAGTTNVYYAGWRPVTVYINGEYFGLYEMREKIDEEFFQTKENANPDSTDILGMSAWYGGVFRPIKGSIDSFYVSYAAFNALNPADTDFWNKADRYFDMTWYNDYIIAESWLGNTDWPGNNIKVCRSDKSGYRWRYCLVDVELSLEPNGWTNSQYDHIHYMLTSGGVPHLDIWLKGIQNARFRNYFINRFADLMNTEYKDSRLSQVENSMYAQTVAEMPREYQRWGDPNNISGQMINFLNNHLTLHSQFAQRTAQVRNHIKSGFSLAGQVNVTLNAVPAGAGKIKISTIVPDSLPWTGVYFNGNPVKITAMPNPGFVFSHWDTSMVSPGQMTNPVLNLNISHHTTFNAIFNPSQNNAAISISELNYHSDTTRDAGDWIEFRNYGSTPVDISGWRFTDSLSIHNYLFPQGTLLQPGDRVVLCEDTLNFHAQHPGIPVFGPTGFGFSNSSELLTLFDTYNTPVLSLRYHDALPWPPAADGYGYTLELLADTLDPNLPGSWFAGCLGGSPSGAYFPCNEQVIFDEVNYKSSPGMDAGDWVELLNRGTQALDISGWKFSDSENSHIFTIPSGTVLSAYGYLVLYSDAAKFTTRFPWLQNIAGPFSFGLSSDGEAIRLFDGTGKLCQSMVYDEDSPWPPNANGNGYTLEIVNIDGNLCDGTNWMDGCPEGSPGGPIILPCQVTGIESQTLKSGMKLYPNPSHGKFTVTFGEPVNTPIQIEVFNPLGELVRKMSFTSPGGHLEIDLSGNPDGIYYIMATSGNTVSAGKAAVRKN